MISIKKDATSVIVLDVAVSKSYVLLQFVDVYKNSQRVTLCTNSVVSGLNTVEIVETSGTIDQLQGQISLRAGDWKLYVYEQVSSSNLDTSNATFIGQLQATVFDTECLSDDPCQCPVIEEIDGGDASGEFADINGLLDGCGA